MTNISDITQSASQLPEPDEAALLHSQSLKDIIKAECLASQGFITFRRYMELALYEPAFGYYSAGLQKFGEYGDFITAPEVSPIFSQCVARQCAQIIPALDKPVIVEFGAGSGVMAAEILLELERCALLPDSYLIIELSADLRLRQKQTITALAPKLLCKVRWLDALPDNERQAIVLANEVLDAMPVECFQTTDDGIMQLYVKVDDNAIQAVYKPADESTVAAVKTIEERIEVSLESNYQSDFNPVLEGWVSSIAAGLDKGVVLLIDYGYSASEYYHSQRKMGTLICHYQHRAHADPFWCPGLQDITAFVDFSAVAYAAVASGMEVSGYTTQTAFLMAAGLDQIYAATVTDDAKHQLTLSQQIKTLTLPSEMGERFKVIALTKNLDVALIGFSLQDNRGRL